MDYVLSGLCAPRVNDEKTMTHVIHDKNGESWTIIRYETYVVIEKNGRCRVYDEDDVSDVLRAELRDVARIEKWRLLESAKTTCIDTSNVRMQLRSHFEHFEADSETRREARIKFKSKHGLLANTLELTYDGKNVTAVHRCTVKVGRYDTVHTTTTFGDIDSATRFVQDHLSFRDDIVTVDLGRVAKIVEIKILEV